MALGESQNYNTVFGRNLTRPLTQMTLREVERDMQARINGMPGYPRGYSASGKYQFIRSTFIATVDAMGLDWDNVRWTPDVQDAMAIQLLVGRGYRRWLNNEISTEQFQLTN